MAVIGLTGNIASGKSLVSASLKSLGARVIDADTVAREVVLPGTGAWHKIVETFGPGVLNRDRTLNRVALGAIVFGAPHRLKQLNEITHPVIVERIKSEIDAFRSGGTGVLVVDAPLLIETGLHRLVDEIWVVEIPADLQVRRLTERDRLTREQALERVCSQMATAEKRKYAQVIIDNSGDAARTRKIVERLWQERFGESGVETVDHKQT